MTLPSFTAECSLNLKKQHYLLNINVLKIDQIVRPQFNVYDCYESCRDSCCICLHDPEGIIESSCDCNQQCINTCIKDCTSLYP